MHFFNMVNIDEIFKEGSKIYKTTFKTFLKYALLAVTLSYLVSIYVGILDTFLFDYDIAYIIAIVLLVLLFLPIAYYSIRVNMTAASKFKALIEGQPFNFKEKFKESKHEFWRVFFVLAAKFLIRLMMLLALLPIILYVVSLSSPGSLVMQMNTNIIMVIMFFSALIAMGLLYLLTRLEFASLIIYWHAETDKSDLSASMKMTKSQYFAKLKLMIVAHIPNLVLNIITTLNFIYNFQSFNPVMRWGYILGLIVFNTVTFSWSMSFYYPLFKQMKAFALQSEKLVDEEGREWLTF